MLKKMVNGKEVICDPEEESQILADWEANDSQRNPPQKPVNLQEIDARLKVLEQRAGIIPVNEGGK